MVKDILLFSTADWDSPYLTNKQHMARLLRDRGFRILYVESLGLRSPTKNKKDLRRLWKRLIKGLKPISEVEKNIFVLSPLTFPFQQHRKWVQSYNAWFLRFRIFIFGILRNFKSPLIWTYHPFILRVTRLMPQSKIVYHCVDDLSAVPGIHPQNLKNAENELAPKCLAIFTTSIFLQNRMSALAPGRCFYFNNVADIEKFSKARTMPQPPQLAKINGLKIGYVGVLSDYKLDFGLIHDVVKAKPEWQWIFVGEEREGQNDLVFKRIKTYPNVHCLGHVAYDQIPAILAGFDIAILPTLMNDYTRSMFPMKFFEYLAAGLPVVATPLPSLEEYSNFFTAALGASTFISAIERLEQIPKAQRSLDLKKIEKQNWQSRLDQMFEFLDQVRNKGIN